MRGGRTIINSKPKPFMSTWKTDNTSSNSSATNQIRIPLTGSGLYNFMVYWGDNTSSSISSSFQSALTHSYATAGTYNVTMSGYINGFQFSNTGDRRKLINISQWGGLKLTSLPAQFYGCDALTLNNISDTPNLYTPYSSSTAYGPVLNATFRSCSLLVSISRANEWDTSKVNNMSQTFYTTYRYNQNIGNWNTSNVTNMTNTFCGLLGVKHAFNNGGSDSIKNWDTSKVQNFSQIFLYNDQFNQPIGSWNVSSASIFNYMFYMDTAFNQPLNNWNTVSAISMSFMFNSASLFNQPLNNWNTSNTVDMTQMFYSAYSFNQDVGSWDVSKVRNMYGLFGGSNIKTGVFNNGGADTLKNWNTSNVTDMSYVFFMSPYFNQNIGTWDTSKVTTMLGMFGMNSGYGTGSFNNGGSPSINNWNTSNVNSMYYMFNVQTNFNQPIGNWDVSKVTNFQQFLNIPTTPNNEDGVFNQNLSTWNPISASNLSFMFNGQPDFNSNLGSWNLSKATNFQGMFKGLPPPRKSSSFNNGDSNSIKDWVTTNVTTIDTMFQYAYGFNQPLTNWNIGNVTAAGSFMGGKSNTNYSSSNYDALLIGWASRPVKPNISISFNNINYTIAASASRAKLVSAPNNWTIVDGGQI
jgi:surface protein